MIFFLKCERVLVETYYPGVEKDPLKEIIFYAILKDLKLVGFFALIRIDSQKAEVSLNIFKGEWFRVIGKDFFKLFFDFLRKERFEEVYASVLFRSWPGILKRLGWEEVTHVEWNQEKGRLRWFKLTCKE